MSTLSVENISVKFGDFFAVNNISLEVNQGEFVTLLGPSGCGKTTLLKVISGFYTPDPGVIKINGKDVTQIPPEKRDTTMCFQSYALFPHLNVSENIVFGLKQHKVKKADRDTILNEVVRQVDLGTQLKKTPDKLSGGQQQRVALARALAMRSGIILFDEPLSNLDARLREQVRFEILGLQQNHGFTVIYVTHDQSEALAMSDKIVVMNKGRTVQWGAPYEIYNNPVNSFVARFIGEANIISGTIVEKITEKQYRTETEMGDLVVESSVPPNGKKVQLCWRPEVARLLKEREGINSFEGLVDLAVFQGNFTDLLMHQKNAQAQKIPYRIQLFQNQKINRGDRITFKISPKDIRFLESLE